MTKAPISLQDLRRRMYRKAKSDKTHRFWGLFVHITKVETLEEAYRIAKSNGGAAGVDGQKFSDIESAGRSAFLASVREDPAWCPNRGCSPRPAWLAHSNPERNGRW